MIDPSGEEWSVDKKCDALEMELSRVLHNFIEEFTNLDEELESISIKPQENVPYVAILGILDKIKLDFYMENKLNEEGLFEEDP
jgi:hypothetical protein